MYCLNTCSESEKQYSINKKDKYQINSALAFLIFVILILFGCNSLRSDLPKGNRGINNESDISSGDQPKSLNRLTNSTIPLKELLDSVNLNSSNLHIEIDKSEYTLSVLSGRTIIKQYPVVLGDNPIDDKLREGDRCTPEGTFKVVIKYPHKKWSKFILIDYPNVESLRKFNKAKEAGIIPSYAKPGGEIGIHGVPDNDELINFHINWTAGCISLKNKDINEIYTIVCTNTQVIIRK
jgi:murein L,D-transpeptidase YafK